MLFQDIPENTTNKSSKRPNDGQVCRILLAFIGCILIYTGIVHNITPLWSIAIFICSMTAYWELFAHYLATQKAKRVVDNHDVTFTIPSHLSI